MDSTKPQQHELRKAINAGFSIRLGEPEARRRAESILRAGDGENKWQLVKQNRLRSIYRVETDSGAVFVKAHVESGVSQALKSRLLGDPAQREFEASHYASAQGIPCVHVFAAGKFESEGRFRSFSFSHALDNTASLASMFQEVAQADSVQQRSNLIASVAQLLGAAHRGRFLHADEHPGNIMVTCGDGETYSCVYIDVYGARCKRDVTLSDAASSIASLGQWFRDRASRSVRLSFVKQYIRQRKYPQTASFLRTFLAKIESASQRHRQALYRKRDRRIGKSNAHFQRLDLPNGWRAWTTARFRNQSELTGVAPPAATSDLSSNDLLNMFGIHPSGDAGESLRNDPDTATQFSLTWWRGFLWRLFGSPLRRVHESGCQALNRDIPTEIPSGCIEQRGAIVRCAKRLVTRPPQCLPLVTLLDKLPDAQQRQLLERVGWLLARTFDRNLVILNMTPRRIEVTCHKGENVPLWTGILARPTRKPVSASVRNWMLTHLTNEALQCGCGDTHRMARVLRACVRRTNPADRWRDVWREVQKTVTVPIAERS